MEELERLIKTHNVQVIIGLTGPNIACKIIHPEKDHNGALIYGEAESDSLTLAARQAAWLFAGKFPPAKTTLRRKTK
ncbi:MAG: hypothetical protein KF770_28590 [Anaerolineae bacterium]|nr:hypothetical protein [Anaerolineae bacterium]